MGMGAFRIGFRGVFLNFPGSTVPTLDFSHIACLDFHVYVFVFDGEGG